MADTSLLPASSPDIARADARPTARSHFVGILPAAGGGSRLQPLVSAKELLPVLYIDTEDGTGLRPVAAAEFALASMYLANVRNCLVVVSDTKPEIARYLGNGSDRDMTLGYLMQPTPLGLADAIDLARPWIGDRFTCLALPDTVFSPPNALDLVCRDLLESGADLVLGVFPVSDPCQLGPVRFDEHRNVLEVSEKPSATDLHNSWGIAAWSPVFTDFLHDRLGIDGPAAHPSIGTLFNAALDHGLRVRAVYFPHGEFLDAGTPQGLKRVVRTWAGSNGAGSSHTGDKPPTTTLDPATLLAGALAHHAAGALEAATATYDRAQEAQPGNGGLRLVRAALSVQQHRLDLAMRIVAGGPLAMPDDVIAAALSGAEEVAGALTTLGERLTALGYGVDAALAYRTAIGLVPAATTARAGLAALYHHDGRLDEALAQAWQAVEWAPDDAAAHGLLGWLLRESGHVDEARAALEQALRLDPDSAGAHHHLGFLFAAAGDKARAEEHLQRAIMADHTDVEATCRLGWLLHDTDRLERAETIARRAVAVGPDTPWTHHLLGYVLMRQGRAEAARAALERALELAPEMPDALSALANLDLTAGDSAAAVARLLRAVAVRPDDAELRRALAWALHDDDEISDAVTQSRRALALAPERPEIHAQLTWLLIRDDKLGEAAGICFTLLARYPDHAEAYRLMGEIEFRKNRYDDAEAWLLRALAIDPRSAAIHGRLGSLRLVLNRPHDAEPALRAAIDSDPDFVASYRELALLLDRQGRFDEAEQTLRTLLERKPADAVTWFILGRVLENDRRDDDAAEALRRALALDEELIAARRQLARLHVRGVAAARALFADLGDEILRDDLREAIFDACIYRSLDEYRAIVDHALALFPDDDFFETARRFFLVHDVEQTLETLRAAADELGRRVNPAPLPKYRGGRRPRVAYVGNFLHRELMGGYFRFHDLDRFDIFVFSDDHPDKLICPDPRLRFYRPSDVDLADACAQAEIDLVIDMIGPYPAPTLFDPYLAIRQRLAPVQCLWMTTSMTTASTAYDFLLADPCMVRPDEERWYTERVIRLPHCQWFCTEPKWLIDPGPLPALTNGYVTFGSSNRGIKINDTVLNLWASTVARLPTSRFRVTSWHTEFWQMRRYILGIFAAHGVTADRIDFVPPTTPERLPVFYQDVDISLDVFPFTGGLSTLDALWMGVPVVTLAGKTYTGRQSETVLRSLGADDWIARDHGDFAERALRLVGDLDGLAATRAQLRERLRTSPLCDAPRFARDMESAFLEMIAAR